MLRCYIRAKALHERYSDKVRIPKQVKIFIEQAFAAQEAYNTLKLRNQ